MTKTVKQEQAYKAASEPQFLVAAVPEQVRTQREMPAVLVGAGAEFAKPVVAAELAEAARSA